MFGADALQEMLFQMKDGKIRLFPAIPEEWKKKKFLLKTSANKTGSCAAER